MGFNPGEVAGVSFEIVTSLEAETASAKASDYVSAHILVTIFS